MNTKGSINTKDTKVSINTKSTKNTKDSINTKDLVSTKGSTNTKNTMGSAETMRTKDVKNKRLGLPFVPFVSFMSFVSFVPFVFLFLFFVSFVSFVSAQQPQRIVSLVPNLTEMLYAIGAGPQVVAVSSYDEWPPEVSRLPKVGALIDPDTERILSLRPDLVITYGSQTDLQAQLERASIPFFSYRHGGLAHISATMRALGARTGHVGDAETAVRGIEARIDAVRARVARRPRPKTLLVFGREPRALRNIYASGGRGFLHDMLEAAGGDDVLSDIDRESVQTTTELILARAPEVILELRAEDVRDREGIGMKMEIESWSALSSVPAVKNGRVIMLTGKSLVVPGPRVADAIEQMAKALHP